jgi:hypothetical protein
MNQFGKILNFIQNDRKGRGYPSRNRAGPLRSVGETTAIDSVYCHCSGGIGKKTFGVCPGNPDTELAGGYTQYCCGIG